MTDTWAGSFVTTDHDEDGNTITFDMIEDESGDIFWGYGHIPAAQFIPEVNRWLDHVGIDSLDPADMNYVEHVWARFKEDNDERFDIIEELPKDAGDGFFPVTRLVF